MGDLSPHFSRHEFKCKCGRCQGDGVDGVLLAALEDVRSHFGTPITVTSGFRCASHNRTVGGAKYSQHQYAKAADIRVDEYTPSEIYEWLDNRYQDAFGIGVYDSWVHLDIRSHRARWDKRRD